MQLDPVQQGESFPYQGHPTLLKNIHLEIVEFVLMTAIC